jgi:decaprenylphospho-beta-D-ribofuranose 2-oxidase
LGSTERPTTTLTGWGRATATAALLERPGSLDAVADALARAGRRGVIARGLGRSYGDAAQNAGGGVLAMTGLDRVRAFDAATGLVVAEAGCSLDQLLRLTVPTGWWLPAAPGTRFVTLGGAVANDVHGKAHRSEGSIRRAVRELELLTPANGIVVVTPDGTPELFAATLGGLGLTGVVLTVTLQLRRIETSWLRLRTERAGDLDATFARMAAEDPDSYSVAWVDCLAERRRLGRAVITKADHARTDELAACQADRSLEFAPRRRLAVPPGMPAVLGRTAAVAFNQARFARAPRHKAERLVPLPAFFWPLDAVHAWNRLYGPSGFVQYQFVVPEQAETVIEHVLGKLVRQRFACFLGVLKRLGTGGGMLSFPVPGWTLAVDLPAAQPGLGRHLDGFDELVAAAGGRVYLAKDARLRRSAFRAMYPELGAWRRVRERFDPSGMLRSDLGRRLGLDDPPAADTDRAPPAMAGAQGA